MATPDPTHHRSRRTPHQRLVDLGLSADTVAAMSTAKAQEVLGLLRPLAGPSGHGGEESPAPAC